jgi:hypothetical protein
MPPCRIPQRSEAAFLSDSLPGDVSHEIWGRPKVVVGGAGCLRRTNADAHIPLRNGGASGEDHSISMIPLRERHHG